MAEISQVQTIGDLPPKTWDDYRRGCRSTFHGGLRDPKELRRFQHGMDTVFNLLEDDFPSAEQCRAAPHLLAALQGLLDVEIQLARQVVEDGPGGTIAEQIALRLIRAREDVGRAAIAEAESEYQDRPARSWTKEPSEPA